MFILTKAELAIVYCTNLSFVYYVIDDFLIINSYYESNHKTQD